MFRKITILCLFLGLKLSASAQERCSTPLYSSGFKDAAALQAEERRIQAQIVLNKNALQTRSIITIPVVVHIIYNRDEENIPDSQIFSQIEALNRDYRRRNTDAIKTPDVWQSRAADIGFEFCLASKDPDGNATSGITRTRANRIFTDFESVKHAGTGGYNGWAPQKYLNIWVANIGTGLYGFSPYPTVLARNPQSDGIVINYKTFGVSSNNFTHLNFGRTAVHEIGHWFNLIHTWGDASNCATDFVDDTPPEKAAAYGCSVFPKYDDCSFTGSGTMFMNYMDYGDDLCMNLFTKGQKDRMLAALTLYRPELLTSNACGLVSGINEILPAQFSISPNPIENGTIQCRFNEFINEGILSIFDLTGKIIFQQKFYASNQQTLSLPQLGNGLYFVQLITEKGNSIVKVMKDE